MKQKKNKQNKQTKNSMITEIEIKNFLSLYLSILHSSQKKVQYKKKECLL